MNFFLTDIVLLKDIWCIHINKLQFSCKATTKWTEISTWHMQNTPKTSIYQWEPLHYCCCTWRHTKHNPKVIETRMRCVWKCECEMFKMCTWIILHLTFTILCISHMISHMLVHNMLMNLCISLADIIWQEIKDKAK